MNVCTFTYTHTKSVFNLESKDDCLLPNYWGAPSHLKRPKSLLASNALHNTPTLISGEVIYYYGGSLGSQICHQFFLPYVSVLEKWGLAFGTRFLVHTCTSEEMTKGNGKCRVKDVTERHHGAK